MIDEYARGFCHVHRGSPANGEQEIAIFRLVLRGTILDVANGRVGFNAVVDAVGDVRLVEYLCNARDNASLDEAPVGDDLCLFYLLFVQNLGDVANSAPSHDEARGAIITKVILKRHEQTPLRFLFFR